MPWLCIIYSLVSRDILKPSFLKFLFLQNYISSSCNSKRYIYQVLYLFTKHLSGAFRKLQLPYNSTNSKLFPRKLIGCSTFKVLENLNSIKTVIMSLKVNGNLFSTQSHFIYFFFELLKMLKSPKKHDAIFLSIFSLYAGMTN